MRQQGTVVRWAGTYGFIMPLAGGGKGKLFVHHGDIQMEGYRELYPGDVVSYEVEQGDRGSHAVRVTVIQSAERGEGVTVHSERGN